ncbi:hypothetical protein LS71_000290 [Helicobacter jaachi]|uniref:TPM domain-containing protein n=1 Tax=Helicobacter jaachi TaxID=1677920 RepID=A0A4U8TBG2_9HELI|nr:hypothetical protein LS71_000290 [Helicobacter jaachi]
MFLHLKRLAFASLLCTLSYASSSPKNYVLDNPDWLLVPKSVAFVQTLSNELFTKTGYSLYVALVDKTPQDASLNLDSKASREHYKQSLTKHLSPPYTLIVFMKNDEKMDIISSQPQTYLDEEKVYFEYMVPLLPKQKDEALTPQRISAIVLNGYAQAADMIAAHFDVKLEHNMKVDESGGQEFVRFSMYIMLLIMFGILALIYFTRRK